LVFSNPFAAALLPGLLAGLVAAQYRAVRRPGMFPVTWTFLAVGFFFVLSLSIPLIQQMPPVRAADATPWVPNRFLPLADGSSLFVSGKATVLIPQDAQAMSVSSDTQFDALNQRFVFSTGLPKDLGSTGPERTYFQYTPALASLQTDLLALYTVLRDSFSTQPFVFWFQSWAVTWLFLGFFFFFSLRTWPLVHIVLVLLLIRLGLMFLAYSFWSVPALVDLWVPSEGTNWLRTWAPIFLIDVAAASLFFMTWLSKPYKTEALS